MTLTEHQNEVLKQSLEILKTYKTLVIKGSAGVGKTTMVQELIIQLKREGLVSKKVICSAPTNKAVMVLKAKTPENYEFITVHKALKMTRKVNYKNGNVTFEPQKNAQYPPLSGVGLLVVDEASMLNSSLIKYISDYAYINNTTVIYLGDNKQLNPIGEENSPVFSRDYKTLELTEIIRQGEGSPIINLSRNTEVISSKEDVRIESGGYVHTTDLNKIIQSLAKVNGSDELKYLAWTNKDVDFINDSVRKFIYGDNPRKVEVGESIIFNSPFEDYFTNEEVKVDNIEIKELEVNQRLESPKIAGQTVVILETLKYYLINGDVKIIHEESELLYKSLCKQHKSSAIHNIIKWREYFQFAEKFADIKYNHALTVHKSQGSTYQQTIINVQDMNKNRKTVEKERLLYTAITRASNLLILYKS